jgi:hypothetical protein
MIFISLIGSLQMAISFCLRPTTLLCFSPSESIHLPKWPCDTSIHDGRHPFHMLIVLAHLFMLRVTRSTDWVGGYAPLHIPSSVYKKPRLDMVLNEKNHFSRSRTPALTMPVTLSLKMCAESIPVASPRAPAAIVAQPDSYMPAAFLS